MPGKSNFTRQCVVVHFDCHSEQAFFASRGIWAIRAKRRVLCDAIIARLDRFPNNVHHYPALIGTAERATSCLGRAVARGQLPVVSKPRQRTDH